MEKWATQGEFNVNFICICVNGDSTSLPVAKEFATQFKMAAVFNGYIAERKSLPSFGQLGCQGLILVDSEGNFISKRSAKFMGEGESAWRKVEKQLFELGVYQGDRTADSFEEPPLRFNIGDRVECRCGANLWLPGQVVAQRVFAMGREMPYKILLQDGRMTVAPIDSDHVIRKPLASPEIEIPSVGIQEMDDEHESCINALNQLREERSEAHLKEVYQHLQEHFKHEEELFAASGFGNHGTALSGTKSHCDDHTRILSEIESQFGERITEDFVNKLIEHVVSHTRDYDTKYAGKLSSAV